jgi:hypothetical protein
MHENITGMLNAPLKRELQFRGNDPELTAVWELIMGDSCDIYFVKTNKVITYIHKI